MDTKVHEEAGLKETRHQLTLLSLRFDHTQEPDATSALHVRRDSKRTVSRPEWVLGNSDFEGA